MQWKARIRAGFLFAGVSKSGAAGEAALSGGISWRLSHIFIRRALRASAGGEGPCEAGLVLFGRTAAFCAARILREPCGVAERPFSRLLTAFRVSGALLVLHAIAARVHRRLSRRRACERMRGGEAGEKNVRELFRKKFKFPLDSRFRIRIINSRTARKGINPKARNPIRGLSSAGRAHGWQP